MPEDDYLRLDARDLRNMAALNRDDMLAEAIAEDAHRVLVSPEAASAMTGLSPKAIRGAVDRGDLKGVGKRPKGRHRWIKLSDLVRRGLDPVRGLKCAFQDARQDSTLEQEFLERDPDAQAERAGYAALLAMLPEAPQ